MEIKITETYHFNFLANFQTLTLPRIFPIVTHVMLCDTHSKPGLPVLGAEPPHVELCRVASPGEEG